MCNSVVHEKTGLEEESREIISSGDSKGKPPDMEDWIVDKTVLRCIILTHTCTVSFFQSFKRNSWRPLRCYIIQIRKFTKCELKRTEKRRSFGIVKSFQVECAFVKVLMWDSGAWRARELATGSPPSLARPWVSTSGGRSLSW